MHASPLTTVVSLPDQRLIASAGYDGAVVMWTETLQVRWQFQAADLVNLLQFSPEGRRLAVASADGFVYVLDVRDGSLCAQLGPHGDDVNAVAWHPAGDVLACVMDAKDARVAVWQVRTGEQCPPLMGHEHGIFGLAFSPDGEELVTAAEDGTCRIWHFKSRTQRAVLSHPGDPETVAWSPCGRYIASGCDDGVLRLWDARQASLSCQSDAASAAVRFVAFSGDGKRLLSGSYEGVLRVHQVPDLVVLDRLSAPMQWEKTAAFLHDGALALGSFGGRPMIHRKGEPVTPSVPTFGINAIAASPSGEVCIGRDDGAVMSLHAGRVLHWHDSIVNTVSYGGEGGCLIASGDYRGHIRLFDVAQGLVVARAQVHSGPINTVVFQPGADLLYTAGYDGVIRQWDLSLNLLGEWGAHKGPIKSLTWSKIAGVLIAASSDDTVSIWRDGLCFVRIAHDGMVLVNGVAASPCSPHVATASRDGLVRIWHALSGELLETLPPGHVKSVKAIAYSPDGHRILTGSYDGSGILWQQDEQGAWRFRRLNLHGKPGVPAVAFSGDVALTAGWDGSVGRWSRTGALIAQYRAADLHAEAA